MGFPSPEDLYPDWKDWAKTLGRYLVDEEIERRRSLNQRLGRIFFTINHKKSLGGVWNYLAWSGRKPIRLLYCTFAWYNITTTAGLVQFSNVVPPSAFTWLKWDIGVVGNEQQVKPLLCAGTTGVEVGTCIEGGDILAGSDVVGLAYYVNGGINGAMTQTFEAEDLSWNS